MKIAIIGWGSLIRCPGSLTLASKWHRGGPKLPLEFARKSSGNRLTLVIHDGADPQPTFWAMSGCNDLQAARDELRAREGTGDTLIHSVERSDAVLPNDCDSVTIPIVLNWLPGNPHLDAAVWTGLDSKWPKDLEGRFGEFSERAATAYLEGLQKRGIHHGAELYFRHVPPCIDTPIRRAIERKLEWRSEVLPEILLEPE